MNNAPPYKLVRARRKTVGIYIQKDASVEVRAPLKLSQAAIDGFVASKSAWIAQHVASRAQKVRQSTAFSLNYGDSILLCGAEIPILERDGKSAGYDGECFYLPPGLTPEEIKKTVVKVYITTAKGFLARRTAELAQMMGVTPSAVKIGSAKTRWGSCSGKKSINYSWRLIMAGERTIDYVIVHELAHLKELNHSPRFWAVVKSVIPDAESRKRELKALQDRLSREDWDV